MSEPDPVPAGEYVGAATVRSADGTRSVAARVSLAGHFEPIDGRFHWHGRLVASKGLDATFSAGDRVEIDTEAGSAAGKLSDVDPWGRLRITGTGAPPF